jgi:CCR4-NOT transcription complex subunit 9
LKPTLAIVQLTWNSVLQVGLLAEQPSVRLLKHIVRCYLRLSDNPRAREALRQCLPDLLRSPQFTACLKDDPTTCRCYNLCLAIAIKGHAHA